MVFASIAFVFGYLPLFLTLYYAVPAAWRNLFLTLASYLFYGWWRPDFVLLMFVSTVVDYVCGRKLGAVPRGARQRRWWLLVSLATNLGLLAYFKYANLMVDTFSAWTGNELDWTDIVLPVGISFYTFQSMSYSIDVYRGEVRPVKSFLDLACFVSMFPQLVAGPIVRYRDVENELSNRRHDWAKFSAGVFLFMIGFVKKLLIADNVAAIAGPVFAADAPGFIDAWLGVLAYALQIYFDFSGYSDMAIGLGLMIGFHLPENFNSPYHSASITEFWRRWHISLSTWLRDYLYVPLGGNRKGPVRTYLNLGITMLLGGLWHGAEWTFLLWGGYQGLFLILERLAGRRALWASLPAAVQVPLTFVVVLGGWAIFNAQGVDGLRSIYGGMFGSNGLGQYPLPGSLQVVSSVALIAGLIVAFAGRPSQGLVRSFRPGTVWAIMALFAFALGQLASREFAPFIYFRF